MNKIIIFAALMLAACMLFSCATFGGEGETTTSDQSLGVYAGLVDLLRTELDQLKKDQNADAEEYQKRIKELEDKIAALTVQTQSPTQTTQKPDTTDKPSDDQPLTYTESNGEITITGCSDENIKVLVIPEKIDGKPVTAIADSAFASSDLTGVSLPAGLKEIGWFAFSGCVYLMNVSIPVSVESIGYDAFGNCPKLTVYCPANSFAERYAKSYGLTVVTTS
ncbi:MAG: leucine-rich repeat domain-containing protein [Ruminococcaceae bacterium]|nr:leucine-rich repeat domain-containing protein [Oscillospiraceae bacterium]